MTHPYRTFKNIYINAKDEAERTKRIDDLLKRGFEVVNTFETELDSPQWFDSGYKEGSRFRHKGTVYSKKYHAVMRKAGQHEPKGTNPITSANV